MKKDLRFKEIYKRQFLSDFFLLTDVEAYIANMAYIEDMIHFGFSRRKNTMDLASSTVKAIKGKKRFNATEHARRQLARELMSCTLNFNGDNDIDIYAKLENGRELFGEISVRIESAESEKIVLINTSGYFILYDEMGEEHDCSFDPCELNKMVYDEYEGAVSPDIEVELGNKMIYDRLLTDGFGEDDFIEGVFLIEAANKDEFLQRRDELQNNTKFCDPSLISYEEDEEGGLFKTIMEAYYTDVASIKKAWEEMTEKYEWLYKNDSSILFEGIELWSDGKWLL